MHPDDVIRTNDLWPEAVKSGKPFEMEQRFRRGSDGQYRWHLVRGVPVRDLDGRITKYVGANMDIHDQKLAQESLLEERALRERFTNTLTHDLRTPIAAAKMSAQLLLKYIDQEESREKNIMRILRAIERADHMISDLLDANRIKAGERIPMKLDHCNLMTVIQQSVDEMSLAYGDRFQIQGDVECNGVWSCEGLRRVTDNLLGNAAKYGEPGTAITVTGLCLEGKARISVHNVGNELSPEEAASLFTMFRRTKRAASGSSQGWGIGLTLVKGIAEAHGGKAWVESAKGQGTTFFVELPFDSRAFQRIV
jgi:signal transduction histidine kinase